MLILITAVPFTSKIKKYKCAYLFLHRFSCLLILEMNNKMLKYMQVHSNIGSPVC